MNIYESRVSHRLCSTVYYRERDSINYRQRQRAVSLHYPPGTAIVRHADRHLYTLHVQIHPYQSFS